ncbi:MAG: sialidase family protein, partial [bacterium]
MNALAFVPRAPSIGFAALASLGSGGPALGNPVVSPGAEAIYSSRTNTWRIDGTTAAPVESSPRTSRGTCSWTFSPNVRAHPPISGQVIWPDIEVSADGTIGVAWMDDRTFSYHVYYSASTDGGLGWSPPEQVDTRLGGNLSCFPDLEFDPSGTPVVVWEDDRQGSGGMNVYVSRRTGGMPPWSPNVKVNDGGTPPSVTDFMNPSIAVLDETRFYVAWTDWREGVLHQVYSSRTTSAGTSWSAAVRVSDGLGFEPVAGDPSIAVDPASSPASAALICLTNDWRGFAPGGRYPNVYAYRSTDGGASWSIGVQVNDVTPFYQQVTGHSIVVLDDGTRVAGWFNSPAAGQDHLHTNVSTDGGATWSGSVQADHAGTGVYPSIAKDGAWVYAGYDTYESGWNVYFRASADGGRTWTEAPCRVDDDATGAASQNAVVAVGPLSEACLVWQDSRPGFGTWKAYTSCGVHQSTAIDGFAAMSSGAVGQIRCSPNPSLAGSSV